MILSDVMAEMGERLLEIPGLNGVPFAAKDIVAPAALVMLPPEFELDQTYGRGQDTYHPSVLVAVSWNDAQYAHLELSGYISGDGEKSIPARFADNRWQSCDSLTVAGGTTVMVKIGVNTYLGAMLRCVATGRGARRVS